MNTSSGYKRKENRRMRVARAWAVVCALASSAWAWAAEPPGPRTWQRWEQALTSSRHYDNPYADVTLRVSYIGPGGHALNAYGFGDGGDTFRIRCAFPTPGTWRWETECSDAANPGLHKQRGTVDVSPYLDIAGVQTGHNAGNRNWCAHHAIEWNLHLYRHEPHKPVINLEAMYDGQGEQGWQAVDARSLAWRTWLSGAMGYTYGAGDLPPKCPQGGGAVWMWVTDPGKYDYWKKALQWESAFQMQHLHDFLAAIEWWRLEPAHELIRNQPDDVTRRTVLAKTATSDLAVAYLPDNEAIEVDMSVFPAPLTARWFDPVSGRYISVTGSIKNKATHRFAPPGKGDWVLLLRRRE